MNASEPMPSSEVLATPGLVSPFDLRRAVRFEVLDGWRGICALLVALFHCPIAGSLFYLPLVRNAGACVDFFFVLSGFVMMHAYGRMPNLSSFNRFWLKRFGRLYPLHFVTLAAVLSLELLKLGLLEGFGLKSGVSPFSGETSVSSLVTNFFLVHSLGLHTSETWNGPSWSISTEFWTCVVFGILALSFPKNLMLVSAVCVAFAVGVLQIFNHGGLGATADFGIFRCFVGFFLGVLGYRLLCLVPKFSFGTATIVEFGALISVGTFAFLGRWTSVGALIDIAFVIVVLAFSAEQGAISQMLRFRFVQWLGKLSYSIYLVHFVILICLNAAIRMSQQLFDVSFETYIRIGNKDVYAVDLGSELLMNVLVLVYLAVVVAVSAGTWRWIEEPARLYFNRLASRRFS